MSQGEKVGLSMARTVAESLVSMLGPACERIEFGVHAMPSAEAEAAPAWPSLASVRAAADAKFRRDQRKVRA